MTTTIKTQSYIYRIFVSLCLCFLLLAASGMSAKDITPPYLVNPVPEPGSITENWHFIRTGIFDELTGVNEDSVVVNINGAPPRVKPIIEQSYEGKGCIVTVILSAAEKADKVTVQIDAYDLAETPNLMNESWSYTIHTVSTTKLLVGTYPENHRYLSRSSESSRLKFSWATVETYDYFRIEFILGDGKTGTIDMENPQIESTYNTVSFEAENISEEDWRALAEVGEFSWRVAPIDQPQGNLLMDYSDSLNLAYVSDDIPLLHLPYQNALLDSIHSQTFSWYSMSCPLDGYTAVFIRLDEFGQYTNDFKVFETPIYVRTLPMDLDTWNTFTPGKWAWAVLGQYPDSAGYTDFMIQRFRKE